MGYTREEKRISIVTGINAKTVATTTLFTCPTNFVVTITKAIVTATVATAVTQRPVMGIGIAAGETDIFSSRALTGFTTLTSVYVFSSSAVNREVVASDVVKLGIDNGSTATTHTITVELFGFVTAV